MKMLFKTAEHSAVEDMAELLKLLTPEEQQQIMTFTQGVVFARRAAEMTEQKAG